jgi:CO dehydrogenase/acetyl-CoA synthase gamma subunit (corrinoid Fe-S protein)
MFNFLKRKALKTEPNKVVSADVPEYLEELVCLKLKWKQTGHTCILLQPVPYFDIENLGRTIGRFATH